MFQWKREQVLPVVGITVPQEWYDKKVAENEKLKDEVKILESVRNERDVARQMLREEQERLQATINDNWSLREQNVVLTTELEMWKAKALHRKAKPKAVTPE